MNNQGSFSDWLGFFIKDVRIKSMINIGFGSILPVDKNEEGNMKRIGSRSFFFFSIIIACLFLSIPLSAKEEFRAKLLNKAGLFSDRMVNIRISIENYTTPDEVKELQKILAERGTMEFMDRLKNTKKGVINFLSSRGLNLRINAAAEQLTEKGRKILLVMERQSWDTETRIRIDRHYLFMVMELDVDSNGKGKGKLYKGANIRLGGKTLIDITDALPQMPLFGVRKRK